MEFRDFLTLVHPTLAVMFVFPILGNVLLMAWQTRQRRLKVASGEKSKTPPTVGPEHVKGGRILTASVVVVTLIALAYEIYIKNNIFSKNVPQAIFITLMFIATSASLVFLYKARPAKWRGIFATLTGMGVVILGCQEGVYRQTNEWYWSHYYYGVAVALLMIFSLAIIEDIYKDRSLKWRNTHIILNCLALLLFIGQAYTGSRSLLEMPLNWQAPYVYSCDYVNKVCGK